MDEDLRDAARAYLEEIKELKKFYDIANKTAEDASIEAFMVI